MENRLTPQQLTKLVGEVERLSQRQQDELDRDQVQDILRELNLSPDLLDEAMIQLQRKEALVVQQRRQRWVIGGAIASLVVAIAAVAVFMQQQNQVLTRVAVQQSCVGLAQKSCGMPTSLMRQRNSEVFYNVTLKDAPVGKKLSLTCDWLAPGGQIVKQNRYETRQIDTPIWNTHCRYQLDPTEPTGNWQVRLLLDGRELSNNQFAVQ
ncbi:DUF3859 domain-containing protein [Leptolyngbya sp. FACHB-321]|uniref:DUF3859 domain-containing protein n=1 Tax=Leptolyngbya sp. FACHB-321 TaxID=2692807 RepID=UPI0016898547|nr:DUF3859 domain-containing protein [Leptolyngbya sp. FACHB-321]MBD2035887.1 DUF3859 domain-containing protein [Leptolyngbya sp. FACHB-321]